jgi:hypothetical protein
MGEPAHWHFLTEGLAGRGFELSLRVARRKDEAHAPTWATALLVSLAARAEEGWAPDPLQCLELADGIGAGDSELTALAFAADPRLPALPGASRPTRVLAVVPVTTDEARVVREWSPVGLVELLARASPLLVTALDRPSLLSSPRARQLIEQRVEREGSSLATMTARRSQVRREGDRVTWTLSSEAVDPLVSLLKGRTGHRRPFSVVSGAGTVHVVNADTPRVEARAKELTLGVSLVAARQLRAQLKARPGTYAVELLPNFAVAVV